MDGKMKTLGEVRREMCRHGNAAVHPTATLLTLLRTGEITPKDGYGLYHDGFRETNRMMSFSPIILESDAKVYPYVCWYKKEDEE